MITHLTETFTGGEMSYQKCPVCGGCGLVPGGFFGSCGNIDEYGNRTWTSDHVQESCRVCDGNGIIPEQLLEDK